MNRPQYSKLSLALKIKKVLAKNVFANNKAINKIEPISKITLNNLLDEI